MRLKRGQVLRAGAVILILPRETSAPSPLCASRQRLIKYLLKDALTDKIADREVFMKGIDASYRYEGYATYSLAKLTIATCR